jgi:hypothetical protein
LQLDVDIAPCGLHSVSSLNKPVVDKNTRKQDEDNSYDQKHRHTNTACQSITGMITPLRADEEE